MFTLLCAYCWSTSQLSYLAEFWLYDGSIRSYKDYYYIMEYGYSFDIILKVFNVSPFSLWGWLFIWCCWISPQEADHIVRLHRVNTQYIFRIFVVISKYIIYGCVVAVFPSYRPVIWHNHHIVHMKKLCIQQSRRDWAPHHQWTTDRRVQEQSHPSAA